MTGRQSVLTTLVICVAVTNCAKEPYFTPKWISNRSFVIVDSTKNFWLMNSCNPVKTLFKTKSDVIAKLDRTISSIKMEKNISSSEKAFQIHTFEIFKRELNDTENSIFESMKNLRRTLQGDYKDIIKMKRSSQYRLDALKKSMLKEQLEFHDLLEVEKHQIEHHQPNVSEHKGKAELILDRLLKEVAQAADNLEDKLEDQEEGKKGVIEAVLRVDEENDQQQNKSRAGGHADYHENSFLIDTNKNKYVLARSNDQTVPHEDHHFILDIIFIVILSFLCGWICTVCHLPPMFGYIMSGLLLGSAGFNILKAMVQVETLGELGVFFILFTVGLEFSPEQIKKVWRIALLGSMSLTAMMVVYGLAWGYLLHIIPSQSMFVAACLSLSSTPMVVKFLCTKDDREHGYHEGEYSPTILGMLVVQDVQLGLLVATLPALATASGVKAAGQSAVTFREVVALVWLILKLIVSLGVVLVFTLLMTKYVVPPLYHKLRTYGNRELLTLACITLIFSMLVVTDMMNVSMELGCFLAGVTIGSLQHGMVQEVSTMTEPIRDFFACLFSASIGLHIFPSFVLYEFSTVLSLTCIVVILKFLTAFFVLGILLPEGSSHIKWVVASGVAQVSEFSFVLGSRARSLGILSREVYLLIISIATLSLLFAPLLWRLSLWRCHYVQQHKHTLL